MKKVLTLFLLCALHLTVVAQTGNETPPVKSKMEALLAENGTLIETTTEEIGNISNSLSLEVTKIKNLNTGAKNSGLFFEAGNTTIGVIDADEMDLLVKSLNMMKEAANATRPLQTVIRYKSRTGFEISAIFDFEEKNSYDSYSSFGNNKDKKPIERKWMYTIKTASSDRKSSLRPSDFMALCGFVEAAKSKM